MEKTERPPRKSRAWVFLAATSVALVLFLLYSLSFMGDSEVRTTGEIQPNAIVSFVFATIALACAIGSNASAFLNPESSHVTRVLSPFALLMTAILIVPTFITLGLTMVG